MLIALIAKDKAGHLEVRKANRQAHLAYMDQTNAVVQAGPFLDDNGDMCGSLVILDVEDMAAAQEWAANDPYAKADLFEESKLIQWKRVIG